MPRAVLSRILLLLGASVGDALPTEFRLFKAGENETTKGVFLFDAKAATAVMAAWKAYGNDLAIDLEHLALDQEARAYDPDARGWFKLEVRGGELWAVDVRWTPDGARRLTDKTQRYISPAFCTDNENRVVEIVNVALVAMPATHATPALVAASNRSPMSSKVTEAARALHPVLVAKLSKMRARVKLADDAGAAPPAGKAATVKAAAEKASSALDDLQKSFGGNDIDATFAAMEAARSAMDECENAIAAMTGGAAEHVGDPAADPAVDPAAASATAADDKTKQMARERAELIALRKEKAQKIEDDKVAKLAAEMVERSALEGELVRLGRETPATVATLGDLSIDALRARLKAFGAVPGGLRLGGPLPPTGGGGTADEGSKTFQTSTGPVTLTANQLRECERAKAKPEVLAENLASRRPTTSKR